MRKIEAVFLDIGGVILQIDWNRPFDYVGIHDPAARAKAVEHFHGWSPFHLFERGLISADDFYAGFNKAFGVERDRTTWREAWLSLIIGELPNCAAIFAALDGLAPVYALSNTNVDHYLYQMPKYPILKRFRKFFASFEMGERKPDAAIYIQAAKAVGLLPSQILFIDDSFANVEGARRAGLVAERSENSVADTLAIIHHHLPETGRAPI